MFLFSRLKLPVIFFCTFFFVATGPCYAQERGAGLVVSDSELAAQAGMKMLARGGDAVGPAIAAAFSLGGVDPASSGIGGGGFIVIYQTKDPRAHAFVFR